MRLKEIKEGMVIRCANREERKMLWEELCRIGNMRTGNRNDSLENFVNATSNVKICDLRSNTWAFCRQRDNVINFSDLIIKDELTNEEVIELMKEKYAKEYATFALYGSSKIYKQIDEKIYELSSDEIIKELIEYKKSKEIKVVSKEEYAKVASDKLDELYPKGWKVEE